MTSLQTQQVRKAHYLSFDEEEEGDPGMNVGHWIGIVISAVVLLIVLAALFPTLTDSLSKYAANDTSGFGAILVILVPVLIGVAVLLAFVYSFLPRAKGAK